MEDGNVGFYLPSIPGIIAFLLRLIIVLGPFIGMILTPLFIRTRKFYQNTKRKSIRIIWLIIFAILGYPIFLVLTYLLTGFTAGFEQISSICFGISCAAR